MSILRGTACTAATPTTIYYWYTTGILLLLLLLLVLLLALECMCLLSRNECVIQAQRSDNFETTSHATAQTTRSSLLYKQ